MTSFKQIEANRRNALKSTGPQTQEGKERARCNAVRHGLTAETVISALEDAEDYKAFEAAIIADYDAQSAVERELLLRVASLLWRLRRATTIERGLFEIQAEHLHAEACRVEPQRRKRVQAISAETNYDPEQRSDGKMDLGGTGYDPAFDLTRCFLRLANLPNYALDRLSRYEITLWRQLRQTLFALDDLDRRKPQDRPRHLRISSELPVDDGEGYLRSR